MERTRDKKKEIGDKAKRGTESNVRDQMRQRLKRGINKIVILYSSNEGGQSQQLIQASCVLQLQGIL